MPSESKPKGQQESLSFIMNSVATVLEQSGTTTNLLAELVDAEKQAQARKSRKEPIRATTIDEFIDEVLPHQSDREHARRVFTVDNGFKELSDLSYLEKTFVEARGFSFPAGRRLVSKAKRIPE
jgi:hypothetical protein